MEPFDRSMMDIVCVGVFLRINTEIKITFSRVHCQDTKNLSAQNSHVVRVQK